jgi:hypothetical protein
MRIENKINSVKGRDKTGLGHTNNHTFWLIIITNVLLKIQYWLTFLKNDEKWIEKN